MEEGAQLCIQWLQRQKTTTGCDMELDHNISSKSLIVWCDITASHRNSRASSSSLDISSYGP
jgi:hypothetical protein